MEVEFPFEFIVSGTPVSFQAKRVVAKEQWKQKIQAAIDEKISDPKWLDKEIPIAVTLFHFPDGRYEGDIDNSIKLVLDAMSGHIYLDDVQVERIVTQKFEQGNVFQFSAPSKTMLSAFEARKPVLYIRVSDDPHEELK